MKNKYKNLLSEAVDNFYEARKNKNDKDKLYYKGMTEGIIMTLREGDLLSRDEINEIVDTVQTKYSNNVDQKKRQKMSDINTPTFLRDGKDINRYLV
jgi:hypothetical protein